MTVGSTFTLKLLHATRPDGDVGAPAGDADDDDDAVASHTHLRTVRLTLVSLDRAAATAGSDNNNSKNDRVMSNKHLPSKWTLSAVWSGGVGLPGAGIAKRGYNKKNKNKAIANSKKNAVNKKALLKPTTPRTSFGSGIGIGTGCLVLDEDLYVTADERYPNLSAVLFGADMLHRETLVLFHPGVGSLAQNDETSQVLQLAWAPEPFSTASKTMQALDQACARRDRSAALNWTACVVYSDCNSKRRVRRQSVPTLQTFRFDGGNGDEYSEGVLEARFPQCGRAHDTGGWLVYDRGVLRACRGVSEEEDDDEDEDGDEEEGRKRLKRKKGGPEAEVLQARDRVLPLGANVQVIGSRRKRFRSLDELLMVAEELWKEEV